MFAFLSSSPLRLNQRPGLRSAAAALGLALLGALSACTDGTGTAAAPVAAAPAPAPAATIAVSGTAAVGAPLKNATVSLLCGKGGAPTTTTTVADGTFGMNLGADCTAPYLLKVVGVDTSVTPNATVTLFAFADAAGNINITPLTDIAAGIVTGGSTSDLYDAVVKQSKKVSDTWTDTAKKDATTKLQDKLKDLGLDGDAAKVTVDLLQGKFKADGKDPLDALLDKLKEKRGGVPLSSLVESIVQAGGQPGTMPWNVLFPTGASNVTLVGTDCSFSTPNPAFTPGMYIPDGMGGSTYMPGTGGSTTIKSTLAGTVTVTLTKGTSSLGISANSGTDLFTVTAFAVAGSAGGNFSFALGGGDSGFQSVNAYSSNNSPYFSYNNTGKRRLLKTAIESPQESINNGFSINWQAATSNAYASTNYLNCATLTPFRPGKFDLPSRVATVMKGTTSAAASPSDSPCQSQTYVASSGTYSYGTFSYSVSPLGDVKFNGTSLSSDFPSGAANFYYESTRFTQAGEVQQTSATINLDGNSNTGFILNRNYAFTGSKPASFNNSCGSDD